MDDDVKLRTIYERKMADEIEGDGLGDEFKGYVFKLVGGSDKQGFPMKQGVLTSARVQLLLKRGTVGFQKWRGRDGERQRKSVRGCVYGPETGAANMIIVKKGENDIPGLTDTVKPRTYGPKRASKIRKLFNLSKDDDVRKYVIKHKKTTKKGKEILVGPKIQRLVTKRTLNRRSKLLHLMKQREQKRKEMKASYAELLKKRTEEAKIAADKRREEKKNAPKKEVLKKKN